MKRFNVFGESVFLNQCNDGKLMLVEEHDKELEEFAKLFAELRQKQLSDKNAEIMSLMVKNVELEKQVANLRIQNKNEIKWRGEMWKRLNKRARRQLILNLTLCVSLLFNLCWLVAALVELTR